MSVIKRGKAFSLKFAPFGREVWVSTKARTKAEAVDIERQILVACRAQDYRVLDPVSREVCVKLFRNQQLAIPPDLGGEEPAKRELTLWQAAEIFLNYPGVKDTAARERHVYSLAHIIRILGRDVPVTQIWIPQIREYFAKRSAEGAAPGTVNKEKATLSRLFQVLVELQHLEVNPVRLVKRLSEKSGEREVYISFQDVQRIVERCPEWYRPLVMTLYYGGLRAGEARELSRRQVSLSKRMIYLGPEDTKERHRKRVPIHKDLVPILEEAFRVTSLGSDKVFLMRDNSGVRAPSPHSIKNPWVRTVAGMDFDPKPRLHDLRHTWRTNARRSGVDAQIAEMVMGHWFRGKAVSERYGRISDQELLDAVDKMTFDHGETEIWTAR
ncbi:MAG: tyrosine-type recombinase/integrase [Thermodesulfobacteriota bacterium]